MRLVIFSPSAFASVSESIAFFTAFFNLSRKATAFLKKSGIYARLL